MVSVASKGRKTFTLSKLTKTANISIILGRGVSRHTFLFFSFNNGPTLCSQSMAHK